MNTKEQILKTALEMYASKGSDAVSIRDIAYAVGIKESTIYYHFQNKQDILDQLHAMVEAEMDAMKRRFLCAFEEISEVTEADFIKVALHYRHAFYEAYPFDQFIAMLSIERHANPQAEALYQRLLFDIPLAHQEQVFRTMHEKGIFRSAAASLRAKEYHYTIFGAFMNRIDNWELTELIRSFYQREVVR